MGTKHRGKRMFYYKYFTLNKMKEVHIMSKKILKRSLALGALMAFVITGSAWAEYNNYELPSGEFSSTSEVASNSTLDNGNSIGECVLDKIYSKTEGGQKIYYIQLQEQEILLDNYLEYLNTTTVNVGE